MNGSPSPNGANGGAGNVGSSIERGGVGGIMRAAPRSARACPLEHSGGQGAVQEGPIPGSAARAGPSDQRPAGGTGGNVPRGGSLRRLLSTPRQARSGRTA